MTWLVVWVTQGLETEVQKPNYLTVILTQNVIFLLPNHDHLTTLMTFQKSKCELFDRELYFESLNRHCIFIIANLTAKLEG